MRQHNIVVIGASAGGVSALQRLFSQFPQELQASFFVVLHIPPESPSLLAELLDKAGPLTAKTAKDGDRIYPGHVYVAPPDFHLLVKPGVIRLHRGPRENRHRPAIDPLFRSAAIAYSTQTIGVVLTGYLDDGASGLSAIKRCGGLAVVQSPEDADYPDMPSNAIAAVDVDCQVPIHQMGSVIQQLIARPAEKRGEIPADIVMEAKISERTMSDIRREEYLGHPVAMSCPECNGPLWQMEADRVKRYRCHVGHSYTARTLLASQDLALEQALWAAMRTMEERGNMASVMAKKEEEYGRHKSAQVYTERAEISKAHAKVIRKLLVEGV